MAKIRIYRFTKYNIDSDEVMRSRRWATREAIGRIHGTVLEDTAVEVDESVLGTEIEGMTVRDFNPKPRGEFQTQIKS
jgi:hypothetical protein